MNELYSCFYPVQVEVALLGASVERRVAAVRFTVAVPFGMNSTVGCNLMLDVKSFNESVHLLLLLGSLPDTSCSRMKTRKVLLPWRIHVPARDS